MTWFYISFAKPKSEGGFQGATVVEATSIENALTVATMRGLNPGGEAAIAPVLEDYEHDSDVRRYRNRLVSKEEIIADGGKRYRDLTAKEKAGFDREARWVCSCCNPPRRH